MKKFSYKGLDQLKKDIEENDFMIQVSEETGLLKEPIKLGNKVIPNSLVYHPMEGGDSTPDGSPSMMTIRKYERYARGGAGLIWIEAVSVCEEGRSNGKQLMITKDNINEFIRLKETILSAAKEEFGEDYRPLLIIQLNHSGRYSKPKGQRKPIIATHKPMLDARLNIDNSYEVVDDQYLNSVEDMYVEAALLCKEAGFDGVDVKACHGYLFGELLSAFERDGNYGGSYRARTSIMFNTIKKLKKVIDTKEFVIASRINLYDAIPFPQGWGVNKDDYKQMDLEEPIQLVKDLVSEDVKLINITMGNPYFIPHINRPFDNGGYTPDEDPLYGCNRLIEGASIIQQNVPDSIVVGVGYSWFREFAPYVAAGSIKNNYSKMIGFGRLGIAYPDFAKDLFTRGEFDRSKICISCSKCSDLKKNIGTCGCVIRDQEYYLPMYKKMKEDMKNE